MRLFWAVPDRANDDREACVLQLYILLSQQLGAYRKNALKTIVTEQQQKSVSQLKYLINNNLVSCAIFRPSDS
jgi:hypothetical protein